MRRLLIVVAILPIVLLGVAQVLANGGCHRWLGCSSDDGRFCGNLRHDEQCPATAPAAAPPGGSAPVSESRASYGGLHLTLETVGRGWVTSHPFVRPDAGNEYLTLDIRIENAGSQAQAFNLYHFELVLASDRRVKPSPGWREPAFGSGMAEPGRTVRGWLTFEVPVGVPAIQLLWSPRYDLSIPLPL